MYMKKLLPTLGLAVGLLFASCGDEEGLAVNSFSADVAENTPTGTVIGTVDASAGEDIVYTLENETVPGALIINPSTGQLTVGDASAYDFETNTVLGANYTAATTAESLSSDITINITDIDESLPMVTFVKADDADPMLEANQDRITDNVWITRDNEEGGQIYNIRTETVSDKNDSPAGTEWALGTLADGVENLTFDKFRATVGQPKSVVGKDLVVHLLEDDIYLNIKFTSWSTGKNGGFAYTRSAL